MNPSSSLHRRQFMAQASTAVALGAGLMHGQPVLAGSLTPATTGTGTGTGQGQGRGRGTGTGTSRNGRALPDSPTARVTLGKTGIQTSLFGMGTGSVGVGQASNQTRLGVKEFTRIVRHAIDRGITFFDVADQYGSHTYLRAALQGVPRDKYTIQTKTHAETTANARSHVERFLMELGVDYVDNLLLHCMQKPDWPQQRQGAREYLSLAREKGLIRAHGVSCHGIDPLRIAAKDPWVMVDLARINPEGQIMDAAPDVVASELEEMHQAGKGVIGMKILAEGRIRDRAKKLASIQYALNLGSVDTMVIGFESTAQIDEILQLAQEALDALKAGA